MVTTTDVTEVFKNAGNLGDGFGEMSPRERVVAVQSEVLGVTDEECHTALLHCHWHVTHAVR